LGLTEPYWGGERRKNKHWFPTSRGIALKAPHDDVSEESSKLPKELEQKAESIRNYFKNCLLESPAPSTRSFSLAERAQIVLALTSAQTLLEQVLLLFSEES
jgi:hypothetical protein